MRFTDERSLTLLGRITRLPEFNVAVFAMLLNYPWEFLQVPLFAKMPGAPHWEAIKTCTRATFGDAVIMLLAFWVVSAFARSRYWVCAVPRASRLALFVSVGVVITVTIEWLAQNGLWIDGWHYSALMPVLPGLGVGLSPVLQWILLPPLAIWFVRRQMSGIVMASNTGQGSDPPVDRSSS